MGGYFLEDNNFIPADPLKTPEHIAPVWYFTPYYAMLRAVPSFLGSQFWGVIVMGIAVLIFFALPWLDRGTVKSIRYRGPLYKAWLAAFVVSFLILGYLGVVPVTVWGQFADGFPLYGGRPRDRRRARAHHRLLPLLPADAVVHGDRQDQARAGKGDRMMNKIADPARRAAVRGRRRRRRAASSGGDLRLEPAPINRLDVPSLQRGARTFVNYCLNCHSAKYMRYNRLTDLGIDRGADPGQPDVRRPTRSATR